MSLKGDRYETLEEIRMRLEGTVVLYDGKPVFIRRVDVPGEEEREIARVYFCDIPFNRRELNVPEHRKYLSSRKFDLTPPKLGFANFNGQALYIARTTARQNQQGLNSRNILAKDIRGQTVMLDFGVFIASQSFADLINGVYPSFKEAGELLNKDNVRSVAISRSFAFFIEDDFDLLYLTHKGAKCGIAVKGDKAFRIPEKYKFLQEELEEHKVPMA